MAYNAEEQLITAPVSIRNLQDCFGLGDADLGTIITNAAINMWARFKPVKLATVGLITDAQRASVNHGIIMPEPVTGSSLTGSLIQDASANVWTYERPTGTYSSPFRLADFANTISQGYFHGAVPPIQINYPKNGWTFMRGASSSRIFTINFELDPSDSAINLQAEDFTEVLDLNEYKFVAYIQDIGMGSSDFILVDGQISGDTIDFTIPSGTGSYNKKVSVCMYRYQSGRYELLPIPMGTHYDPSDMLLKIVDDASASGGGIPGNNTQEMFENVEFSPTLNGTYRTAWVTTDPGTGQWCMVSQGSLYVKMTLSNTSGSTSTVQRGHFQLDLNGLGPVSATTMYNASKSAVTSVQIANNGTATIYLFFDGIFTGIGSDWTSSNKNSSWSMDFTRNGATLLGCDIYAMKGTDGWTER